MSKKVYRRPNREPSHAGRILKTGFIDTHELSVETVAELLGITRVHLSRIINGHSPVTLDLALRLAVLTQTTATQWLDIQAKYDAFQLEQQQTFRAYRDAVNAWTDSALGMQPGERRQSESAERLAGEIAVLAKQVSKRRRAASS